MSVNGRVQPYRPANALNAARPMASDSVAALPCGVSINTAMAIEIAPTVTQSRPTSADLESA